MTSSENLFVKTFPGKGGIVTREDSRSSMSRKCSKSLYLRRTLEALSYNHGDCGNDSNPLFSVPTLRKREKKPNDEEGNQMAHLECGNVCLK